MIAPFLKLLRFVLHSLRLLCLYKITVNICFLFSFLSHADRCLISVKLRSKRIRRQPYVIIMPRSITHEDKSAEPWQTIMNGACPHKVLVPVGPKEKNRYSPFFSPACEIQYCFSHAFSSWSIFPRLSDDLAVGMRRNFFSRV